MGGRSQEFICRGGSRIFSRAVEQQLSTLAYIQDAAVIGVPEGHSQQKMWGFVVLREEYDDITEDELLEHASELTETGKLHHIPDKYRILKELPKEKGKLNKDALRSIAGEKPNGDTCINTPKSKDDIVPKEQGRKTSIYIKPKNEQGKEASHGKKWVKSSGPIDENGKRNDTDVNPDTKSTDLEEKKRAQAKESTKRFNDRSAIENTIAAFPPIEEVAVVEAPQQYVDSHYAVMWAYVVLKHTHQGIVSESELLQYARNQLKSGHMSRIPDRFIILDSLPEGPNGSIDRKQLRNLIMTKKPREFDSTQGVIRPKDSFARERLSKNNMNKDEHNQFDERTQHGVESFLLGLGLFDDLAVISTPGNRSYIMIWAFVVCKQSGKAVTESELHEASAGMKSAPDRFVILDDLPKRAGRVDMKALRDHTQSPFMAGRASNRAVVSKKNYEPNVSTGVKSNHTVEHFLLNLGLFEDLAVIMAPSNKSYRTIWAFVVCKQSDRGVTESDLHEASAGIKEAPDRFIILDVLPKRAGRVDMEALNDHIQSPFMANSLAKNKSKRKETTGMKTKHTVEEFLLSMGIFEDLAVVAAPGNRSYSMIWAFVVCKQSDKGVTEKELHDASAGMKGAPDRFVILDDLPKRGGRVDMEALHDHVQSPLVENSVLKSNPERKETAGVRTKHTVEHYLLGLGIFEDLAVVAAPGNRSYTMIWAFVVCKQSDKGMTESDLHEASAVMKEAPDRFVILDDLPKKGGRVDMEALNDHIRSPFMSNSERKETAGVKTKHTVEHFLLGLGLFEDLAVVAAPGNRSYSMIWAFVVFKQSDKGMTESDLHDASAGLKGAPDRFVILDDLPKRAGRVDMKALNDHIQSPFMPVASKKMVDPISRRGSRVDVNAQNSPAHSSFKKSYDRRDSSGVRTTHTVEHFLLGLGIFADLAVITSPNASRSYSMIWAFVVCKQSDKGVTESELHEASAGMKGAPDRFVILDDLPKRGGRVDMEALRNHVQSPFMQKERTYRY